MIAMMFHNMAVSGNGGAGRQNESDQSEYEQ